MRVGGVLSSVALGLGLAFGANAAPLTSQTNSSHAALTQVSVVQAQTFEVPKDQELAKFARAYARLSMVHGAYYTQFQAETDRRKLDILRRSAIADMASAVELEGLKIPRYNQIAAGIRNDEELAARVDILLEQLAESPNQRPDQP